MKQVILASTSPRRQELLSNTGLEFESVASDYEEDMSMDLPPHELAKVLSAGKAEAVAKDYADHVVIGADTFVVFQGKLLGKPKSEADAKRMLRAISGQPVSIITGYTIIDTAESKKLSESVETQIFIKPLTDSEIDNYIATGEPMDKAGAFAVQGLGGWIVERIEGDFFSVVGLPVFEILGHLRGMGVSVL